MKIFCNNTSPKYVIDICGYLSPDSQALNASVEMQHPKSINKIYRLTDTELDIWRSVVESVVNELDIRNFEIIRQWQSRRSYSYYIDFYPVTSDGTKLDLVQIRFRLSDHGKGVHKVEHTRDRKLMFRDFTINDFTCPANPLNLKNLIGQMCDDLMKGDYSTLWQE